MMRHSQDTIVKGLCNTRREADGSVIADCPACSLEGKGAGKIKVFLDGNLVCYRFSGVGSDEHKHHIESILAAIGLDEPTRAFIKEVLLDGKLTIEINPASRGRTLVVARNCDSILARDEFYLDRMPERARFVRGLGLEDDERNIVAAALVQLADRLGRVQEAVEDVQDDNLERVSFKVLEDGRIIEQVVGRFAVYDPALKETRLCNEVEFDGVIYCPLEDSSAVKLADTLIEYNSEAELDDEIERYIYKHVDLNDRDRKLAARYVRFSYIADQLLEVPYLRPIGRSGNGKSRYIQTIGSVCYRPFIVVSPSAASLYRLIDAYRCTLAIDEGNFADDGEDTSELIRILNSGYQKGNLIPRCDKGKDGKQVVETFDPFGPKLVSSLKIFESQAFESRCIPAQMYETTRNDIKFRMSRQLLIEQAELRAKLLLWRLRNCSRDIEDLLDAAEIELRQYKIRPRHVQIATPLYALIDDKGLRADFASMLEERTSADTDERQESFDGNLVECIHGLLFKLSDDGVATLRSATDMLAPENGKPCEFVTVAAVTEELNVGVPEKRKHDDKWVGKQIRKLGLRTSKIRRRASEYRNQSALVFDTVILSRLFKTFSLPVSENFDGSNGSTDVNSNENNDLGWSRENQTDAPNDFDGSRLNYTKEKDLSEWSHCSQENSENEAEINSESASNADSGLLVSLDVETQTFDKKRGITPRNAKLLGISLCYDGQKADYVTDSESWPFMIPGPEQTVVFHNAKFDFGVLERAGLPLPPNWEDTLIASHLLDEKGEHGLKELAKSCLGEKEVLTFKQATGSPLFDPDLFEEYARNDSRFTFRLWQQFKPRLEAEELNKVYELEKAIVPVVLSMERAGMRVDAHLISSIKPEVFAEIERIEAEVFESAGCKFDLKSPAKVAAILYDKLGVPCNKKTKKGQQSVESEALEEVRGYHPVVDPLLRYRELDKLASAFIKVLPKYMDERGRIHPEFKALGTVTGRFSCSNPNVQQMPAKSALGKRLRQAFIADEGNKLVVADYSQMELRVLAHYSRDPLLIQAYTSEADLDLHTLTASRMFNKRVDSVSKQERGVAKIINFGIAYGITPLGLFNKVRPEGHDVTLSDCEKFIKDYFRAYSGVSQFLRRVETTIKQRGYVRNWYGRRRRVQGNDRREIRQAQNFIIQATAADIAKDAMIRLHRQLLEGSYLIAQVHDEFIVECREEQAYYIRDLMTEVMTEAPDGFTIPLKVDAHIVSNWGEAK